MLVAAVGAALLAGSASAWTGKPGQEIPFYTDDGSQVRLVVDESCDANNYTVAQLHGVLFSLATYAAEHEGTFGSAALRNNAILRLHFVLEHFTSRAQSDEQVRRELTAQRNGIDYAQLARQIRSARRGPCRTDLLAGLLQVQAELASSDPDGRPATLILLTNGIVVGRGLDFRTAQPPVAKVLARIRHEGLIPHFPGLRVVLVAVARATNVSVARYEWLQSFWKSYIRAAGGIPYFVRSLDDLENEVITS